MKKRMKGGRIPSDLTRAYWMGVGISAQIHGDGDRALYCSDERLRKSIQAGYNADNYHDVSKDLIRGRYSKKKNK